MGVERRVLEFEWDKGNIGKNKKHRIDDKEAEEPFFDKNKVIYKYRFHSQQEERLILLGKTKKNRIIYIVFTKRGKKVRIISARDVNRKEIPIYEKGS